MENFFGDRVSVARTVTFVVRSDRAGSESFVDEIREAIWSVSANVPLARINTLGDVYEGSLARTSFTLVMLAIAATMALLLGVVGIYGVIAYIATQRTREIGIRVALGAQTGDVSRLFLRHGVLLTLTGIALGIGVAMPVTRVMSALLFRVSPIDPITYAGVAVALAAVSLVATYLPARRASRIDPVLALRTDR
jgi:ABC-type antimicrobial peptide transport system permease subunit